jgi:hypothetical protein
VRLHFKAQEKQEEEDFVHQKKEKARECRG